MVSAEFQIENFFFTLATEVYRVPEKAKFRKPQLNTVANSLKTYCRSVLSTF